MAGGLRSILPLLLMLLPFREGIAQTYESEHYRLRVATVAEGLERPWSLAWLPDGRMLVTERPGRLRIVSADGRLSDPVKGVPEVDDNGQGGLLDILVDPGFAENRTVYFSFAEPSPDGSGTAVVRAELAHGALSNLKVLFRQQPKVSSPVHFGSRLALSPDGTLFITVGERGQRDLAQDPTVNRGQVIRIHTDGRIPADNPFVGRSGYRPETWSYGHRNPQGAAINPGTGVLWIHEHGARGGDEVNIPKRGGNHGWPVISYGTHYSGAQIGIGTSAPGMEQPIHYWDPSIAPSGMAFYTGEVFAKWRGNLLVGALKFRMVVRLTLDGERVVGQEALISDIGERIRDVRQGPDGYLYLLTDASNGRVLRLEPVDR
jgi:glucose/arabinose dehydrogenase